MIRHLRGRGEYLYKNPWDTLDPEELLFATMDLMKQ
jgi:hypothetical protein